MRKITLALALALVAAAAITAPSAQAQTYPDTSGLTAFAPDCNYMSKAGYLRYTYYRTSGTLISYEEALRQVK